MLLKKKILIYLNMLKMIVFFKWSWIKQIHILPRKLYYFISPQYETIIFNKDVSYLVNIIIKIVYLVITIILVKSDQLSNKLVVSILNDSKDNGYKFWETWQMNHEITILENPQSRFIIDLLRALTFCFLWKKIIRKICLHYQSLCLNHYF